MAALKQVNAPARKVTDPALLAQLNAPTRIGAPDGSTVEFPAGTSDDTIKSAMGKAYPPPKGSKVTDTAVLAQLNGSAPEPKSYLSKVDDVVRALANGMTFGLADRFAAGMDAATGRGAGYDENLAKEREKTDQFASEHPVISTGANLVGGAAVPIGAIGAAAKGVGLGTKMLYGAGAGAGIGGIQGAAESRDWTDPVQVAKDTGRGIVIGGAIGGAIPAAGKMLGAGYNAVANATRGRVDGMSRAAGGHLINAMEADGPATVQQRMRELGPDATLADAGPAFLGKAQGASLNSDEGRSVLQGALTTRNEGTNARIQSDVNRALGPAEDPQTVTNAIKAHRTAVDNVNYPAALDNAPPVKIAPVMIHLLDKIDQTPVGSMERKALEKLQDMLTKTKKEPMVDAGGYPVYDKLGNERFQDVPYSHDEAHILHKVKQELDNVIEYDAPGLGVPAGALSRQQAALKELRHAINQTLELQVPGYANANRVSAALAKRGDAVEAGTQYLGSGKTIASPDRFAAEFEPLSPGERIAFGKGSRGNIERVLGTKANDLQALRTELQGEGGWNTDKIATVHGQPAADELAASVDRNLKFRDTYNKVVENSQTAQRQSARDAMKPVPPGEVPLINPNMTTVGLALAGAKKAANAAYGAVRADPTRHYGEVAQALTEQGAARDARIQSIIDALKRRQGNAALSSTAGDRTALVGAIGANAYATRRDR
ncbi:hypothetical protein [Bradyrhizobium sp. RDM4]|uniref:hypothetical protein n=1 Tax=Bradyrhizobium sp. RDM4 TaxID=3378765 RepID=UPI0038FD1C29